jgi:hypothetical protein
MGSLKPGATYTYERIDDITYAREVGSDTREAIGWKWPPGSDDTKSSLDKIREDKLWGDIRRCAETNPALQKVLGNAILIYQLSKGNS